MIYTHRYISGARGPPLLRRLLELVRRLLALAKLREGLDELDSHAEHFIQLKIVEGLEEEPGDRGSLLELILDGRWIKITWQGDNASHLSVHLLGMDRFVEFVDDLVKLLPDQPSPEAVGITLRLIMPLKPLCTFSSLNSWIATLLDLCSTPLPASGKLDQLWVIADLILLRIVQVVWGPAVAFEAANRSHEIIAPCRTKEDGQAVLVNEIRHVVSLVDVALITYDLSSLLGGQSLYTPG